MSFRDSTSGSHRGRWSSCSDCHKTAGNFAAFECIYCHAHSQTSAGRPTSGRANEDGRRLRASYAEQAAC